MRRFRLLKLRSWYKLHKWLSIFTGAIIAMWLVSGIVMVVPGLLPRLQTPLVRRPVKPFPYEESRFSPADAVAQIEAIRGVIDVSSVNLTGLGSILAYRVEETTGTSHFVDTTSGTLLVIDGPRAEELAVAAFEVNGDVMHTERLEQYDFAYVSTEFELPLPIYRVTFDDDDETYVHVAIESSSVTGNNRHSRKFLLLEVLHTFAFLRALFDIRTSVMTSVLWSALAVSLLAALIGYYMALPHKRRARSK